MKKVCLLAVSGMMLLGLVACNGTSVADSVASSVASSAADSSSLVQSSSVEKVLTISGDKTVYVEGTVSLSVKCSGKNVSDTITWSSNDDTVATVSSAGVVTGVKAGSATITAAASGYTSATYAITVKSNVEDITVSITPAFATTSLYSSVQDGYSLFFASSLDSWASTHVCTYNSTTSTWDITLTSVPFDNDISYNVYYDKSDSTSWGLINTESVANSARTLSVLENTASYAITATFDIPSTLASLNLVITPTVTGGTLGSDVYVWAASNANSWTPTLCTKNEDGTFTFADSNVPLGDSKYAVTLMLGSQTDSMNWKYKSSDIDSKYYTISSDDTSINVAATFATQPDLSAVTYDIGFTFNVTDVPGENTEVKVVIDDTDWDTMTAGTGCYTYTAALTAGAHTYYFYAWANNQDNKVFADSSSTEFSITVSAAASVSVTGSFTSGTGSIDA